MDLDATSNGTALPEATPLGGAAGVVLDLSPELGRWMFGAQAASVLSATEAALAAVTGSSDAAVQIAALVDPAKAAALRVQLARIAAAQADEVEARAHADLLAQMAKAGSARPNVLADQVGSRITWSAAVVSLVVLLTFAAVIIVAFTRTMPSGAEPVLNVLLGTLGAMATSVVGYWVGSSAGSARKEERLASLVERG